MNDQSTQPDLQDRQLIPARSRVSLSREIGEAVVTENIFGTAKVRIIRKNDKFHRTMWLTGLVGAGIAAALAWQGWMASHPSEPVAEVIPAAALSADTNEMAAASQAQAVVVEEAKPLADAQTTAPVIVSPAPAVIPAKPVQAPLRPVIPRQQPAAAPSVPASGLLAPPHFATSLPPRPASLKPTPAKPAAASEVAAAVAIKPQTAASSPVIAKPLSSPQANEVVPAAGEKAAEAASLKNN